MSFGLNFIPVTFLDGETISEPVDIGDGLLVGLCFPDTGWTEEAITLQISTPFGYQHVYSSTTSTQLGAAHEGNLTVSFDPATTMTVKKFVCIIDNAVSADTIIYAITRD